MNESRFRRDRLKIALRIAFMLAIASANSAKAQDAQELTLSRNNSHAVFPLDQKKIQKAETIVLIRLVREENPDQVDFTVIAALGGCRGEASSLDIPVGALGVYPRSEAAGSFALDLGPGLKQVRPGSDSTQVCLKLQLQPLRDSADWRKLRVIVTAPEWKTPPRS